MGTPPLHHQQIRPVSVVAMERDETAFQKVRVRKIEDMTFPFLLGKEEIIIDFGDHYTGYLHLSADGTAEHIPDSPTLIQFTFGEMPVEIAEPFVPSKQSLSVGWLQEDYKSIAFMPYEGSLERRYAFRYLKLKREDSVYFNILITDLYIDAVSAVSMADAIPFSSGDPLLDRIDQMCLKTLKECEQEVFEDGPKRDRRLWIGDLRLQALTDYKTFQNLPLIRHCIDLFGNHRNQQGLVAPCVFPDTAPYVDQWIYLDYSMCFCLCLADWYAQTGDKELPLQWYDVAVHQLKYADSVFDREKREIEAPFFIDHGDYNRNIAALGYFSYVLCHMKTLATALENPTDWFDEILAEVQSSLLFYRRETDGLFVTKEGELSWQSQIWAALSGALSREEGAALLRKTEEVDPSVRMSSPFMMHYYLEALYQSGSFSQVLEYVKRYWGAIIAAGFDCCPECFDLENDRITPYASVIMNSACHAWSCTAAYWIRQSDAKKEKRQPSRIL